MKEKKKKMTWKSRYHKFLIGSIALIIGSIITALAIIFCIPQPLSSQLYTILLVAYGIIALYMFHKLTHP